MIPEPVLRYIRRLGSESVQPGSGIRERVYIEFQDRILYGRDYFDNVHQEVLGSLNLPDDVLAKIYSGNALKLVPLS
ncbi:hypothetical protein FE783_30710 [Paenibacillus mesophilus]|uniref:hypothetical protein n=1 Tax=Paenibacillus mesophilus TaxID=2582849 RepID=UPI00110E52D2|nr:hypothetical protein [Paenibacillus mesophilus]TMV45044.1 hypothetical protein FE783_30710 [Paenibacillus mesophilus]